MGRFEWHGRAAGAIAALGLALPPIGPIFVGPGHGSNPAGGGTPRTAQARKATLHQIILPDLLVVAPKGLSRQQVAKMHKIPGVRDMITFDGAQIKAGGRSVSVIGVNPATFRPWVPLATASDTAFWSALDRGEFVASVDSGRRLGLRAGASYRLSGATSQDVRYAMAAQLNLAGVDLLVNQTVSAKLGLVRQVAGLISAPGVGSRTLTREVSAVLGVSGRLELLRSQQLPVAPVQPGTRPATYLQLFKAAATQYCPGLSWTVLAAIGQIESADGANMGPSRGRARSDAVSALYLGDLGH
jgi:hypothetical protein